MPGPRNRPPKQKKKGKKLPHVPPAQVAADEPPESVPSPDSAPSLPPPALPSSKDALYHPAGPFATDPGRSQGANASYLNPTGRGPTLSGVSEFLETPYAALPDLDDPVCGAFARHDVLDILRRFLPEELALVRDH